MAHVRKMALVDPRLLESLRTPTQSPSDPTLRDLEAEMASILDRHDIDVSEKVRLCNPTLLCYYDMTKTYANKPTRVVMVNEEKVMNEDNSDEENDTLSEAT